MSPTTLWRVAEGYLMQLPGAVKADQRPDGSIAHQCVFTPHSIRATTATLLLDAGVDIITVKELPGHGHITTTQIYDKRTPSTAESASHLLAI
jgi:integrase